MPDLTRIRQDPQVMGGKPCIRGIRVTVGTIVGLRRHIRRSRLCSLAIRGGRGAALKYMSMKIELYEMVRSMSFE